MHCTASHKKLNDWQIGLDHHKIVNQSTSCPPSVTHHQLWSIQVDSVPPQSVGSSNKRCVIFVSNSFLHVHVPNQKYSFLCDFDHQDIYPVPRYMSPLDGAVSTLDCHRSDDLSDICTGYTSHWCWWGYVLVSNTSRNGCSSHTFNGHVHVQCTCTHIIRSYLYQH